MNLSIRPVSKLQTPFTTKNRAKNSPKTLLGNPQRFGSAVPPKDPQAHRLKALVQCPDYFQIPYHISISLPPPIND